MLKSIPIKLEHGFIAGKASNWMFFFQQAMFDSRSLNFFQSMGLTENEDLQWICFEGKFAGKPDIYFKRIGQFWGWGHYLVGDYLGWACEGGKIRKNKNKYEKKKIGLSKDFFLFFLFVLNCFYWLPSQLVPY